MPFKHAYVFVTHMHLLLITGVSAFTLNVSKSSDNAVVGFNPFYVNCTYNMNENEQLHVYKIVLGRKRSKEPDFIKIVEFEGPRREKNATYFDSSLQLRTIATNPTASCPRAALLFTEVRRNDEAEYECMFYFGDGAFWYQWKNKYIHVAVTADDKTTPSRNTGCEKKSMAISTFSTTEKTKLTTESTASTRVSPTVNTRLTTEKQSSAPSFLSSTVKTRSTNITSVVIGITVAVLILSVVVAFIAGHLHGKKRNNINIVKDARGKSHHDDIADYLTPVSTQVAGIVMNDDIEMQQDNPGDEAIYLDLQDYA